MSDNDVDLLVRSFRLFAEVEFAGSSETYARLAGAIAEAPGLAEPLFAAPPRQRRAILYFAAAQYLLRGPAAGHPLAGYLPPLGGTRALDGGLVPAFAAFVRAYGGELAALCATRTTQTNEAGRAAQLRPAFARAARLLGKRPVGLVELGTSAGLLLIPERYGYRYGGMRYGRPDAPDALVMDCEIRGEMPPDLDREPVVVDRVGLDLSPIDAGDPGSVDWLRSCIWPEHTDRLARLDAALAEVSKVAPRMVAGDMVANLPAVLSTVDAVPLVFSSFATNYLPGAAQSELAAALAAVGQRRDLVAVFNEAPRSGLGLFSAGAVEPGPGHAVATLTMVTWLDDRPTVTALAETGPHGQWLRWRPRDHPYDPVG
jgi:hypothetical protein